MTGDWKPAEIEIRIEIDFLKSIAQLDPHQNRAQPRSNADDTILDAFGNALCTRYGTQFGFDIGYMEINNTFAATQNN